MAEPDDLDSILDNALDEFDDEEDVGGSTNEELQEAISAAAAEAATATEAADSAPQEPQVDALAEGMAKLMEDMQKPEFASQLQETFKQLAGELGESGEGGPSTLNPFAAGAGTDEEFDKGLAETLQMLASESKKMENMDASAAEGFSEELMQKMMGEFERGMAAEQGGGGGGGGGDFQQVVDGMMKQLLSKDVMYEPIKQMADKFPQWMADNQAKLERAEYERYGRMYAALQAIVACYETEPGNSDKLTVLMQNMQECGQPPPSLVQELAPGLEFGADGSPLMSQLGPGVPMPGMPGGGPDGQECVVQ